MVACGSSRGNSLVDFKFHVMTLFTLCFMCLVLRVASNKLYDSSDPMHLLDATNFHSTVLNKDSVWVIEFYNSWCGHCIRFAPVWKAFAEDVKEWYPYVEIGSIDCADIENLKICRDYGVNGYPSIRLYWRNATKENLGEDIDPAAREVKSLREAVINYLDTNWHKGVSKSWPHLQPSSSASFDELWSQVPANISNLVVIVEDEKSYVGREIILDFSRSTTAKFFRVLSTNQPFVEKLQEVGNIKNYPALLLQKRNEKIRLLTTAVNEEARNNFKIALNGHPTIQPPVERIRHKPKPPTAVTITDKKKVYMVDLHNAISYALRQEVAGHLTLNDTQLTALKDFVEALNVYFPGESYLMKFLEHLQRYLHRQQSGFGGEALTSYIDSFPVGIMFLPKTKDYIGCKGSVPGLRGYPCSLWTLFHTLTVNAYIRYTEGKIEKPSEALFAIRGYVRNFFSCRECAMHFSQMSKDLEQEVKYPNDTVLWLWQGHNKVNKRLAGDRTEDPMFPKIQFPTSDFCPECRIGGTAEEPVWDKVQVLKFLTHFYIRENMVIPSKEEVTVEESDLSHNKLGIPAHSAHPGIVVGASGGTGTYSSHALLVFSVPLYSLLFAKFTLYTGIKF